MGDETQRAMAHILGEDSAAVALQLRTCHTPELRLFWQRRQVELHLQQLQRMRRTEVQLFLPRDETGCEHCRPRHGQVVPITTPADQVVQADCPQLGVRLCPLTVSGWIDRKLLKTPPAD